MILLEYENIKIFSQKLTLTNLSEVVFGIKKVKNTVPWTDVINYLNREEII